MVAERVAQTIHIPVESAILMLLNQLAAEFEAGNASFLSTDWQRALRKVRDENYGVIDAGAGINLELVHRSEKTKSGFVGVYANGKGFRGMAKYGGSLHSIGTFATAEEAAWRRRQYYKEHRLPYGELEAEMEEWRAGRAGGDAFKGTDEELIAAIRKHASGVGTYNEIFGADGGNEPQKPKVAAMPKATNTTADVRMELVKEPVPIGIDPSAIDEIFGPE